MNNAPTRGYETIVGARTDVRIINHVTVDVWMGELRAKGEARRQRIDVGGNLSDVWGGGISPEEVAARASLPREGGRRTDEALPAEYDPKMCRTRVLVPSSCEQRLFTPLAVEQVHGRRGVLHVVAIATSRDVNKFRRVK